MVRKGIIAMPGPIIHFPTEEEQQATLDEFAREMRRVKERKESVPPDKLNEALETITEYLKTGWSTGGGRRLRQFFGRFGTASISSTSTTLAPASMAGSRTR